MYVRSMSSTDLLAAISGLPTAFDQVAACQTALLTRHELLTALDDLETLSCQLPTMGHRLLARLQTETTPQQMGATSWKEVLTVRWRISSSTRDGGCTKPCCTVGAYGCQVHHATADWADGANTNVDDLALACGPHNRSVNTDQNGWTTRVNDNHEVEWIPPPDLDTGQTRTNTHHRPEKPLHPPTTPNPITKHTKRTRKHPRTKSPPTATTPATRNSTHHHHHQTATPL
ncbi:hypothetical protein [Mycolicibacterium sp.]|uniref:hypothetical protein n=1 Tax=Mycolicibacterium sp. TaxID=2320850 RepID=UPI003D0B3EF6